MSRATRPSVTLRCVADSHHGPGERIVEFNANDGTGRGGLLALRLHEDGTFSVELYRCDDATITAAHETGATVTFSAMPSDEYPELEADAEHVGALLAKESR